MNHFWAESFRARSGSLCPVPLPLFPEVPNFQDLMPDDLRGSSCNNNRNIVHNKFNVLESS